MKSAPIIKEWMYIKKLVIIYLLSKRITHKLKITPQWCRNVARYLWSV